MDKVSLLNPRNAVQREFQESLHQNIVTIAVGPAGTGKTLLALNYAVHGLSLGVYNKIIYIRPDIAVDGEFSRGRGYLPGEIHEKSLPLLAPLLDNLSVFTETGLKDYLLKKNLIEYVYLEDIRGRSINDTFVIFDEAQNSTIEGIKTLFTRIGKNSTLAVLGDISQVDLSFFKERNGLKDSLQRLKGLKNVGMVKFTINDIVRSPILKDILRRYESLVVDG